MDKKIEDYLHLYLGCDLMAQRDYDYWDDDEGQSHTKFKKNDIYKWDGENTRIYFEAQSVFKPILRPLSDMTEEEATEFKGHTVVLEDYINYLKTRDFWSPHEFTWLLSKHFDLFGLIEAGLAIDKTMKDIENNWDDYCTAAAK